MLARPLASAVSSGTSARVLIVDDSAVARTILSRMIAATPGLMVEAAVPDLAGAHAVLAARNTDLVLIDLSLASDDGMAAIPELVALARGVPVTVLTSGAHDAAAAAKAIALGAAGVLAKPGGGAPGRFADRLEAELTELLAPLGGPIVAPRAFDVAAIASSTGGVHALGQLFRAISPDCTTPILITQHLPPVFLPYLASQVAVLAGRPCTIASDRLRLRPGMVVLAPGTAHIRCVRISDGQAIRLVDEPQPSGCRPSADPMFASLPEVFGARALAVLLSGMGRDGSLGARDVADAGGTVVVQDRESSVVWGMPGTVAKAGFADAILSPAAIGALIDSGRRPQ